MTLLGLLGLGAVTAAVATPLLLRFYKRADDMRLVVGFWTWLAGTFVFFLLWLAVTPTVTVVKNSGGKFTVEHRFALLSYDGHRVLTGHNYLYNASTDTVCLRPADGNIFDESNFLIYPGGSFVLLGQHISKAFPPNHGLGTQPTASRKREWILDSYPIVFYDPAGLSIIDEVTDNIE